MQCAAVLTRLLPRPGYNGRMNKQSDDYLVCRSCHHQYFNNPQTECCPNCGHRVRLPRFLWVWATVVIAVILAIIAGVEIAYGR